MKITFNYTVKLFLLSTGLLCLAFCTNRSIKDINAESEKESTMDVSFFPEDNNFAKCAIEVDDGYIIAGHKFTQTGDTLKPSGLIKISKDGKLINKEFYGVDGVSSKMSRLESIFKIAGNRLIQVGQKNKKLWLREIDKDLTVLKDTVFPSIQVDILLGIHLYAQKNGFYVVSNTLDYSKKEFGITYISNDYKNVKHTIVNPDIPPLGLKNFEVRDIAPSPQNQSIYILGSGTLEEKTPDGVNKYGNMIVNYDLSSNNLISSMPLTGFLSVTSIELYKDRLYVCGTKKERETPKGVLTELDVLISIYSMEGKRINDIVINNSKNDHAYDLLVANDKIHYVGEFFNQDNSTFIAPYYCYDLSGKLLEHQQFTGDKGFENRLLKIYETSSGKILLIGKGNGWRVIII